VRLSDPTGELIVDTVRQGLAVAAGVMAITAFFSILATMSLFYVAVQLEARDLAVDLASVIVGLAVTVVVSAGLMTLLAPEAVTAIFTTYPALAYATGLLLCLGTATIRWVNAGCRRPGAREAGSTLLCVLALRAALAADDPWRLLRPRPY
jgi:hypothetical protein